MKKIVSLLLALVMVLSLGVAAFAAPAAGEEDTPKAEETPWVTVDQILQWVKDTIIPNLNMDLMKEVIKQTKATIDNIVELLKPLFDKNQNPDLPGENDFAELPAKMMNTFIDLLAKAFKTDRQTIIDKLLEIPLVKKIMGWYGYKPPVAPSTTEAPSAEAPAPTEVPNTGAAAAVAAVASLSVAAAAAYVSKKKAA